MSLILFKICFFYAVKKHVIFKCQNKFSLKSHDLTKDALRKEISLWLRKKEEGTIFPYQSVLSKGNTSRSIIFYKNLQHLSLNPEFSQKYQFMLNKQKLIGNKHEKFDLAILALEPNFLASISRPKSSFSKLSCKIMGSTLTVVAK